MNGEGTTTDHPNQIGPDPDASRRRPLNAWVTMIILPVVAALAVAVLTAWLRIWWLPFVAGIVFGLRHRHVCAAAVGALSWGLVLLWRTVSGEPIAGAARVTAALAELPALASVIIGTTVAIGLVQGLCGSWLSSSITRATRQYMQVRGGAETPRPSDRPTRET